MIKKVNLYKIETENLYSTLFDKKDNFIFIYKKQSCNIVARFNNNKIEIDERTKELNQELLKELEEIEKEINNFLEQDKEVLFKLAVDIKNKLGGYL